uniref:LysM domain-containing protein n=1 Tax=Hippocampus comes TaxID=109280 RepID=A0A3Q2XPP3_HIPCM
MAFSKRAPRPLIGQSPHGTDGHRNDSLNSIALNFNVTPNKLVQLNKLFCRSVYPGQVKGAHNSSSGIPPRLRGLSKVQ